MHHRHTFFLFVATAILFSASSGRAALEKPVRFSLPTFPPEARGLLFESPDFQCNTDGSRIYSFRFSAPALRVWDTVVGVADWRIR